MCALSVTPSDAGLGGRFVFAIAVRCRLIATISVGNSASATRDQYMATENPITRAVFVAAVAGLILAGLPRTSQAAPIAPLSGITTYNGTQVWWRSVCVRNR